MPIDASLDNLAAEASAQLSDLRAALQKAADVRQLKVIGVMFDKDLAPQWAYINPELPPLFHKVVVGKARAYVEGPPLRDVKGGPGLICGTILPFMCGCKNKIPILGSVGIELAGSDVVCLTVTGAPKCKDDEDIAIEALKKCGFDLNASGKWTKALKA